MSTPLNLSVKHLRYTNEVFTSVTMEHEEAFSSLVTALEAKGFKVVRGRYEYTKTVALTVQGLKSDRAVQYVLDIIRRVGAKAGFIFPFSVAHN